MTISHPSDQAYEPPKEETFVDVKLYLNGNLGQCVTRDKKVHRAQALCCGRCRAVLYYSSVC